MKRIRIVHETQYCYNQPVKFGPHRALLRPREGHDVHISQSRLSVTPAAAVRWLRDIYGNSIAVLTFEESSQRLCVASEVEVELYDDNPIECLIEPTARQFPFQYLPEEQVELMVYRLPSYPYDGPRCRTGCMTSTAPDRSSAPLIFCISSMLTSMNHSNMPGARSLAFSCRTKRLHSVVDRAATSPCS